MAFIREEFQEQDGSSTAAKPTSNQSAFIGGGSTTPSAPKADVGSGFTNLSKYLDVNKGSGGGIANAVTSAASSKIGSAVSQVNAWQSKASQVDKTQTNQLEGFKNQINSDPTKVDANAFRTATSAGYNAPVQANATEGYSGAFNAFNGAKSSYDNIAKDDWASRSSAVTETFKKQSPLYSRGSAILDTFVAQGDQAGKDAFKGFADKNANTFAPNGSDAFSTARTGVQNALSAHKGQWDALTGDGEGSIARVLSGKKASTIGAIQGRQAEVDAGNQRIAKENQMYKALADQLTNGYKMPSTYKANDSKYSIGDFTNDNDRITLEALKSLGGGDYDQGLFAKSGGSTGKASVTYRDGVNPVNVQYAIDENNRVKSKSIWDDGMTTDNGEAGGIVQGWLDKYLKG